MGKLEKFRPVGQIKSRPLYQKKRGEGGKTGIKNPKNLPFFCKKKGGVKTAQKKPKIGHFMYSKKRNRQLGVDVGIEAQLKVAVA